MENERMFAKQPDYRMEAIRAGATAGAATDAYRKEHGL